MTAQPQKPAAGAAESGSSGGTSFHPRFKKLVQSPARFRAYLFSNIPSAFFSGLRIGHVDDKHAVITIPFKWFTRNPFRSIYFACLGMAAEMSTGILAMGFIYKQRSVSMLVTGMEAKFRKKATGLIHFTCEEGEAIKNTIDRAVTTGEAQTITVRSLGTNEANENIAEFLITWSFKKRN